MRYELLKVAVRAIIVERDDDGRVVGEQIAEPVPIYTPEQYGEYLAAVGAELERANNGANGAPLPKGEAMSETTETPTEPETPPVEPAPEPEGDDNGDEDGEEA